MSTIRKRGNGQWQAQVRRRGFPLQTKTFPTRAAAERWGKLTEVEMAQGTFVSRAEAESTTLRELLERYIAEVSPSKKGAASEIVRIKALCRNSLAARFVATIRGADIARYREERLRQVASATVRRDLGVLSHVFEIARKEWGIYVLNPVRDIKMPANGKARDRRLRSSPADGDCEVQRLFDACREARNRALLPLVRLAFETAMRRSELLNLDWRHIDLTRRTAYLPDTKNGEARSVPLSSSAVDILQSLYKGTSGFVFERMTAEALKRAFVRAVKRAGIEDFHFHDLRHEATTRFFERGLNIMEVASITGHKDLRMLRRYTHLKAEDLAKKLN
ncbi:MAG: tyrosine-type recombinase/integrase [Bradyrhizobium sp.]|uniref:tyrosine-type recombinase/integrase n=1 Tax=Bradyrhizobium sp. TaxID=376 RepID=UPI003D0E94FB